MPSYIYSIPRTARIAENAAAGIYPRPPQPSDGLEEMRKRTLNFLSLLAHVLRAPLNRMNGLVRRRQECTQSCTLPHRAVEEMLRSRNLVIERERTSHERWRPPQ